MSVPTLLLLQTFEGALGPAKFIPQFLDLSLLLGQLNDEEEDEYEGKQIYE